MFRKLQIFHLLYSLCQKKGTLNSEFFVAPHGGGGPKITMCVSFDTDCKCQEIFFLNQRMEIHWSKNHFDHIYRNKDIHIFRGVNLLSLQYMTPLAPNWFWYFLPEVNNMAYFCHRTTGYDVSYTYSQTLHPIPCTLYSGLKNISKKVQDTVLCIFENVF